MKKVLEVKGMTCGNCVKRVTKIISGFDGVSDVEVELQRMEATFESDPQMTDVSQVVQAINDFGYAAREKE
jgi:copper chaperone CopZ